MTKKCYEVAGHAFSIELSEHIDILNEMGQYTPFMIPNTEELTFNLNVVSQDSFPAIDEMIVELHQDDDGSQILAGQANGEPYFEFQLYGHCAARMITNKNYTKGTVVLADEPLFGINNALMVMYALSTANKLTALFHSSVVSCNGYGYMFLGKSGTGKSTHSSLWLNYIKGSELINDDNPVVRKMADGFYVFGSPWSGKTPCYRSVKYPIGGIVQLSQAPYNKIERLRPLAAYASLVPSISGKRWDQQVAEGLHETENLLAGQVPVWHLDCLPDKEAACVCATAIKV